MSYEQPTYRRFSLGDGMVVIAGLAPTFALVSVVLPPIVTTAFDSSFTHLIFIGIGSAHPLVVSGPIVLVLGIGVMLELLLAVWLVAFALIRLRRPRPAFRVVARQPGMVAFWSVVAGFVAGMLLELGGNASAAVLLAAGSVPLPVMWIGMITTGRWHPEPSWIDRFGRVLGVCWWVVTWAVDLLILAAPTSR